MNPQSINGSRAGAEACDSCLMTREDGVLAARWMVYFPPQQNPAAPILRSEVGNGGGEVLSAWKKEKMRCLATEGRFLKNQGRTIAATCTIQIGL